MADFFQSARTSSAGITITPTGVGATDTSNISSAISAAIAGGVPVKLGAGTFVITSTISVTWSDASSPGFILQGAGMNQTVLRNEISGGGPILQLAPTADFKFQQGTLISDMKFLGPTTETLTTQSGLEITAMNDFQIKRCFFDELGGAGIKIGTTVGDPNQTVRFTIQQCFFDNCAHNADYFAMFLGYGATTGSSIDSCHFTNCAGGIYSKAYLQTINNCSASYCTQSPAYQTAYASGASSRGITFNQCWAEGNHAGDFYLLGNYHKCNNCYHTTNQTDKAVESMTESGGTVTLVLEKPAFAWWVDGQSVTVQGSTNSGNNGTFTATYVDSKTITYSNGSGVTESSSPATLTLPTVKHFYYELGRDDSTATVTSLTFDGTDTVTLVSPSSHFTYKDLHTAITISGSGSGGNNGTFNITEVVSATTIKYFNESGVTEGAVATYDFGTAAGGRVANRCQINQGSGVSQGDVATANGIIVNSCCGGTKIEFDFTQTSNLTKIDDSGDATEYKDEDGWLYGPIKKQKGNVDQYGTYTCDMSLGSYFRVVTEDAHGLASITQSASVNTIVADNSIFTLDNVDGKSVWLEGCDNAANDGKYTASYVNGTTITVANASGVTEDPSGGTLVFGEMEFKIPTNQPASKFQGRELEIELINGSNTVPLSLTWETGAGGFFANNRNIDLLAPNDRTWLKFIYDDQSTAWVKAFPYKTDYRPPEYGSLRRAVAGSSMSLSTTTQALNGTWNGQGNSGNVTVTSPCKITYTGGQTKKFQLSGHVTFRNPSAAARLLVLEPLKNGVEHGVNDIVVYYTASTTEYITLPYSFTVSLSTDDYVEIGASTLASTLTIDCYGGTMLLQEIVE